ncbi:hypothetical protein NPIL_328611 [Nephila pilipes]|uniref:Uncharacterized protein n=1 Tax=Nephila pilipes TaxID=299642 RepID=A0A8X6PGY7_NEPPI|nr:hypothetical protein NPIL_328611 [Nephila pilipes]
MEKNLEGTKIFAIASLRLCSDIGMMNIYNEVIYYINILEVKHKEYDRIHRFHLIFSFQSIRHRYPYDTDNSRPVLCTFFYLFLVIIHMSPPQLQLVSVDGGPIPFHLASDKSSTWGLRGVLLPADGCCRVAPQQLLESSGGACPARESFCPLPKTKGEKILTLYYYCCCIFFAASPSCNGLFPFPFSGIETSLIAYSKREKKNGNQLKWMGFMTPVDVQMFGWAKGACRRSPCGASRLKTKLVHCPLLADSAVFNRLFSRLLTLRKMVPAPYID